MPLNAYALVASLVLAAGCTSPSRPGAGDNPVTGADPAPSLPDPTVVCDTEAQLLREPASLLNRINGSITVRTLSPGDAIFHCGVHNNWFAYGYVNSDFPVNCPSFPHPKSRCFIGWSAFEIETMIID